MGIWVLISLFLTVLLTPMARKMAIAWNYVDHPGGRKTHAVPVPPIGGLVIIPIFLVFSWLATPNLMSHQPFLTGLLMVWITGALDDKFHISSALKFAVQLFAATLLVIGNGTAVYNLGNLFNLGEIRLEFLAIPFSILCVALVTNALNMIDGLDGLCGGIAFIMLLALICATIIGGGHALLMPMMVLAATIMGFLIFNYRHPWRQTATVFMGDSGSTTLGLILSWLVIELSQDYTSTTAVIDPVVVAWILALPVWDALSLFAYRLSHRRHPFSPDRHHLHYQLQDAGFTVERAVGLIHSLILVFSLIGILGMHLEVWNVLLMGLWIALFASHAYLIFTAPNTPRDN